MAFILGKIDVLGNIAYIFFLSSVCILINDFPKVIYGMAIYGMSLLAATVVGLLN